MKSRSRGFGPLLLTAVALTGCTRGPKLDTRTFELRHLDGRAAAEMIEPYVYGDRPEGSRGTISVADNIITVRETSDNLDKIARVLGQYDTPSPMVHLRFKVIEADGASQTDSAIAEVESALRRLFNFSGYRLLAQAMLSGLEGSMLHQQAGQGRQQFRIQALIEDVRGSGDSGSVRLQVSMAPVGFPPLLETTVSVGTGRTVVLGSSQSEVQGTTLILAVQAELVEP